MTSPLAFQLLHLRLPGLPIAEHCVKCGVLIYGDNGSGNAPLFIQDRLDVNITAHKNLIRRTQSLTVFKQPLSWSLHQVE